MGDNCISHTVTPHRLLKPATGSQVSYDYHTDNTFITLAHLFRAEHAHAWEPASYSPPVQGVMKSWSGRLEENGKVQQQMVRVPYKETLGTPVVTVLLTKDLHEECLDETF